MSVTLSGTPEATRRSLVRWLFLCSGMVFAMIVLGGAVRLTGSGLSMVDWQPLLGIFPPLTQVAWEEVFARYKEYPEYQQVNRGMSLSSFQFIFYMEYLHRLLGRLIGLVFGFPLLYWWLRGKLSSWIQPRLWLALGLGASQGLLGWYMVRSGLVDDPHVSPYRLTAHLLLAVFIFSWLMALALRLQEEGRPGWFCAERKPGLRRGAMLAIVLVFLMIATGGFMAGTRAGFIFNSWPMMGSQWIPEQVWALQPWWRNLTDNPMGVQFVHRWLAIGIWMLVTAYGSIVIRQSSDPTSKRLGALLIVVAFVQVGLGIATLVNQVPLALGVAHQGGALVLLACLLTLWSRFRPEQKSLLP